MKARKIHSLKIYKQYENHSSCSVNVNYVSEGIS
jgi:hypothetical protein